MRPRRAWLVVLGWLYHCILPHLSPPSPGSVLAREQSSEHLHTSLQSLLTTLTTLTTTNSKYIFLSRLTSRLKTTRHVFLFDTTRMDLVLPPHSQPTQREPCWIFLSGGFLLDLPIIIHLIDGPQSTLTSPNLLLASSDRTKARAWSQHYITNVVTTPSDEVLTSGIMEYLKDGPHVTDVCSSVLNILLLILNLNMDNIFLSIPDLEVGDLSSLLSQLRCHKIRQ